MTGGSVSAGQAVKGTTHPAPTQGCWTLGLINSRHRYLSAESFGFRVNCSGKSMKKKQVWVLEPYGDGDSVCLKSYLNKYMAVDTFGNVTCENEIKDDTAKFEISVCEDFSGRWAFKSVVRGYFLGGTQDNLSCNAKSPGDMELWHVHLAAKPQVNLRSMGRKRFAKLAQDRDEIQVDQVIPWGEDTLFTLEWRDEADKYALKTNNNMYLARDGHLVSLVMRECLYAAEYHGGYIALRDLKGMYLSPVGSRAQLKTRSSVVTRDELFSLEDSIPQVSLQAASSGKFVSVKTGMDVTANQDEVLDNEKFQLERDDGLEGWYLRTTRDKYITLGQGGGVQVGDARAKELIQLCWYSEGGVFLKTSGGKYIGTKRSGHLILNNEPMTEEKNKFYLRLTNRSSIVLKCQQGYVGSTVCGKPGRVECNKAVAEVVQMEEGEDGAVYLRGQGGKFWYCHDGGVMTDGDTPQGFYIELMGNARICVKTTDGLYVNSERNGIVGVLHGDKDAATWWEF